MSPSTPTPHSKCPAELGSPNTDVVLAELLEAVRLLTDAVSTLANAVAEEESDDDME